MDLPAGSRPAKGRRIMRPVAFWGVWVVVLSQAGLLQAAHRLALPTEAEAKAAASARLAPPAAPAGGDAAIDARLAEMNRRYQAADFQPELKAAQLGAGVEPAFTFVRDRIAFEAYPGVFRGAAGAYASRAGNAADRALLLAEFLKAKGIATRFALGRLSDEQANRLLNRMFDPKPPAAGDAAAADSPQKAEFLRQVRSRAARDYGVITGALVDKLPRDEGTGRDAVLKEIANHVWVQARVGEAWVDLDPAFADATVGRSYCDSPRTVDSLPDEWFQRLTIRVVAETLDGTALKRDVVLEVTRPVVSLADRQVFLIHLPESGLKGLGGAAGSGGKDRYFPAFWIDGEVVGGEAIAFNDAATAGGGGGGAVNDAADVLSAAPAASAGPRFVAESMEFELSVPGRPPEVTRRTLCDLGGAAWRLRTPLDPKQLHDLPRNENGPLAAQTIHNIWLSAGSHDMAAYAAALALMAQSARARATAPAAPADQQLDFGEHVWPLAIKNLSWVLWGEQVCLPALNDSPGVRFYLDSPRIVLFSFSAAMDKSAPGRFALNTEVDLRRDVVRGVLGRDRDGDPSAVSRRRIWYAALEGALEHELTAREAAALTGEVRVESTSGLLDDRGAVVMAGAAPATGWQSLASRPETAARLREAMQSGNALVVPRRVIEGAESGWWAVDLQTGDTRAVLGDGTNGGRLGTNGSYARGAPRGGSSAGGTNYVDPNTGRSYSPRRTARRGGSEYTTILITISLPGALAIAGVIAVVGAIIWILVKLLF